MLRRAHQEAVVVGNRALGADQGLRRGGAVQHRDLGVTHSLGDRQDLAAGGQAEHRRRLLLDRLEQRGLGLGAVDGSAHPLVLDLLAADAAGLVELVDRHLRPVGEERHGRLALTGGLGEQDDLDRIVELKVAATGALVP